MNTRDLSHENVGLGSFVLQIFLAGVGLILGIAIFVVMLGFLQLTYLIRVASSYKNYVMVVPYLMGGYLTWWVINNPPPWYVRSPNPVILDSVWEFTVYLCAVACMLYFVILSVIRLVQVVDWCLGSKKKGRQGRIEVFRD